MASAALWILLGTSAWAGESPRPFAIADERLKGGDGPDPCETDVVLTKDGNGYRTEGMLHRARGRFWTFCPGARHTWRGTSTDIEGAIRSIDSDMDDPLVFEIEKGRGYVYQRGKGTVVLSDGTSVSLPLKTSARSAREKATAADAEFGVLEGVERRSKLSTAALTAKGLRTEIKKADKASEFVVLVFTGRCADRPACETDARWAKGTTVLVDSVTLGRTGRHSFLRDGAGNEYKTSFLKVPSPSRRELGFQVPMRATDLVWVSGEREIPLGPFSKGE